MPSLKRDEIDLEGNRYRRTDLRLGGERDVATFLGANVPTRATWHRPLNKGPKIDYISGRHAGHRDAKIRYQEMTPDEVTERRKQEARRVAAGFTLAGGMIGAKAGPFIAPKVGPAVGRRAEALGNRLPEGARPFYNNVFTGRTLTERGAKVAGLVGGAALGAAGAGLKYRSNRGEHDRPNYRAKYSHSADYRPPRIVLPS